MVAAVHFYATTTDQQELLDHLRQPDEVSLHPWPVVATPAVVLSREEALAAGQVMVVSHSLGPPVVLQEGDTAMGGPSRAAVFNRMNWHRLGLAPPDGLVDSNASPVLLWTPAAQDDEGFRSGSIGSQADSMSAVSKDYERWVNRSMNRVRRRGTQVWGWRPQHQRRDLDLRRTDLTTVYALPDAMRLLQSGVTGG